MWKKKEKLDGYINTNAYSNTDAIFLDKLIRMELTNARKSKHISQKELAKYLEIDLSTYNKYEKGSRKLSNEVVKKLAEYYNVSVSDIVD